jgi:hypothetical protein
MTCDICRNAKRKTRFKTVRLSICQWCVSELSYSLHAPAEILIAARQNLIDKRAIQLDNRIALIPLIGTFLSTPNNPINKLIELEASAMDFVLSRESIFDAIYRGLVCDKARLDDPKFLTEILQRLIQKEYETSVQKYSLKMAEFDGEYQEKINLLKDDSKRKIEGDMKKYLSFRLNDVPTKSKETRLIRSFYFGIINGEKKYIRRLERSDSQELGKSIRRQDNFRCVICSKNHDDTELHVHHIIPLSQFGTNQEKNLATLCYRCHCKQHPDIDISEFRNEALS